MREERMYRDRADLYDRIYHFLDYAGTAERLHGVLLGEGVADGGRLLEVACGTGNFLVALSRWYAVAGLDRNAETLAIAREKLPDVPLSEADMSDFDIGRDFDVVGCLFSSIGYLLTEDALAGAARCFARALRPGGVLLVQPWILPEKWLEGEPHLQTYESPDLKLCRANVSRSDGPISILDFHWLVVRRDAGVEHFTERHRTRLWSREEMEGAFAAAGFETRYEPEGRGLFVARSGPFR